MKTATYSSLGLEVKLAVPETVEEFDTNAKRSGACLDEATNNVVYRGSLAEFRDAFCEKLESHLGVERKTKESGRKDASGAAILVFDETEADFVKRACATKGVDVKTLQPLADEVATSIAFDASARERKPAGPKKLPAVYADTAKAIITNGTQDKIVAIVSRDLGKTLSLTGTDADIETIGWAIREHRLWKEKQELAGYAS